MAGHDRFRMQGLDPVERSEPFLPCLLVALGEIEVRVVVDAIARYDQIDGGHMQARRMRSVGMAQLDDLQRFSLETQTVAIENLRRCRLRWKLSRKARFPKRFHELRLDLVLNGRNHGCGRDRSGIGESVEQELQTEEVVAVGMGDVNGDEILAAADDPIRQLVRLLRGQKCIDEQRVARAMNERHCIGDPGKVLLAGGDALGRAAPLLGQKVPFQLGLGHMSSFTAGSRQSTHRFAGHHSVRVAGPRARSTRLTTETHASPMMGETNLEYAPAGAQNPSLIHVVPPSKTSRSAATPIEKSAFEISPARQSPNVPAMISIARGNEDNTRQAHVRSFSPDVSALF